MTVRVRFAPSPTGYLHIGGARTALYNYIFAKANKGEFILRIEDTDLERSKKEYEKLQIEDLEWLGLIHDEGPDRPKDCAPYRQSERLDIYKKYAEQLIDQGDAYYCFCTNEELEEKKEMAAKQGIPPHYDGKCRHLSKDEALKKLSQGEQAAIRFHVKKKSYVLNDHVRGRVVYPEGMVGDFIILRSDGMPVYNYACVVDDWLMKITHVFRGEDHLSNTVRQLMLYEAFNATPPEFGHLSLLVGSDRQKLSKRHGATSVYNYREQTYLPEAMNNYLTLLGWSHPQEKEIFTIEELFDCFDTSRFSKSPAVFDLDKFRWVNGQHIRKMDLHTLRQRIEPFIDVNSPYHHQNDEWKNKVIELFKDQLFFFREMNEYLNEIFDKEIHFDDEMQEINSWPTTKEIAKYLLEELEKTKDTFVLEATYEAWAIHAKNNLKVKGKPLFKGMRACLTGRGHGPELKFLIPLTPVEILRERVKRWISN